MALNGTLCSSVPQGQQGREAALKSLAACCDAGVRLFRASQAQGRGADGTSARAGDARPSLPPSLAPFSGPPPALASPDEDDGDEGGGGADAEPPASGRKRRASTRHSRAAARRAS